MSYCIIVLSSITTAKRVEKMAFNYGISCSTINTPKCVSKYGCSHSVRTSRENVESVLTICKNMALEVRGVYNEVPEGDENVQYKRLGDYDDLL